RYSSGLTADDTVQKLKDKGFVGQDYESNPEYTLAHPIDIEDADLPDADSIHNFLHIGHEFTSSKDLQQIIKYCTPLITSFINTLSENPNDIQALLLNYNAILNMADFAKDAIKSQNASVLTRLELKSAFSKATMDEINILGRQPV